MQSPNARFKDEANKAAHQSQKLNEIRGHVQAAVACGITSKGPLGSAKTTVINQVLSLDYLKSEGLYSLRDGWITLHYPK